MRPRPSRFPLGSQLRPGASTSATRRLRGCAGRPVIHLHRTDLSPSISPTGSRPVLPWQAHAYPPPPPPHLPSSGYRGASVEIHPAGVAAAGIPPSWESPHSAAPLGSTSAECVHEPRGRAPPPAPLGGRRPVSQALSKSRSPAQGPNLAASVTPSRPPPSLRRGTVGLPQRSTPPGSQPRGYLPHRRVPTRQLPWGRRLRSAPTCPGAERFHPRPWSGRRNYPRVYRKARYCHYLISHSDGTSAFRESLWATERHHACLPSHSGPPGYRGAPAGTHPAGVAAVGIPPIAGGRVPDWSLPWGRLLRGAPTSPRGWAPCGAASAAVPEFWGSGARCHRVNGGYRGGKKTDKVRLVTGQRGGSSGARRWVPSGQPAVAPRGAAASGTARTSPSRLDPVISKPSSAE